MSQDHVLELEMGVDDRPLAQMTAKRKHKHGHVVGGVLRLKARGMILGEWSWVGDDSAIPWAWAEETAKRHGYRAVIPNND